MFTEFVKKIYDLVEETIEKLKAVDDEIKEVKTDYNKKRITAEVREEKISELNQQIPVIRAEYTGAANEVKKQFEEAVAKFFVVDGSKVHEDAKIFDYDVNLSKEQLQDLVEKHRDNSFMLQLIRRYSEKNNIYVDMPKGEKAYRDGFEQFLRHASYTVYNGNSLTAGIFFDGYYDPHFDK